jgi:transposase
MKSKRSYATVDVEKIDVAAFVQLVTVAGCIVAIDVAKTKFVAALATVAGEVLKLVRFEHPRQTVAFLRLLVALREAGRKPRVVMEPTGTYGDAVRYQCHQRGIPVHMMRPKHTHDFAEVFDGVPSMHDPKSAAVLAKLQAIKPGPLWVPETDARRDLRAWVDQRDVIAKTLAIHHGHLESMLARHWPEFGTIVDVHTQRSWFALLKELSGPQAVAASVEQAAELLRKASRGQLGCERSKAIVDSAKSTMGVPMTSGEQQRLRALAEQIESQTRRQDEVDAAIAERVQQNEVLQRMAMVVGPACAAAIGTLVGSPLDFANATAFEKAMGLNLKERSSGNTKGTGIGITKRGPGQVRQLLYMAALRILSDPVVFAWYCGRTAHKGGQKLKAVVAVMRKLARALWHVGRGETFDPKKLFDERRLQVGAAAPERRSFKRERASVQAPAERRSPPQTA